MTTNQIAWYDALTKRIQAEEVQRHNLEDERIRAETNAINRTSVEKTAEHYSRQDAINDYSARAQAAHYMTSDSISRYSAEATREHYINQDVIGAQNAESNRINAEVAQRNADLRSEEIDLGYSQLENARHIAEIQAGATLGAAGINASAAQYSADISRQNTAETNKRQRHDSAMQRKQEQQELYEQQRHSQAVEQETHRANRTKELLDAGRNVLQYYSNEIAERNAQTNAQNAQTNRYNATTQRVGTIWSNINDSVKTVGDIINNAVKNKNEKSKNYATWFKLLRTGGN